MGWHHLGKSLQDAHKKTDISFEMALALLWDADVKSSPATRRMLPGWALGHLVEGATRQSGHQPYCSNDTIALLQGAIVGEDTFFLYSLLPGPKRKKKKTFQGR